MRKPQMKNEQQGLPWFGLAFLSIFMLAGLGGGVAFFSDNQPVAGLIFMLLFCGVSGLMMFLLLYGHKLALAEKAMLQGTAPTAGISSNNKAGYLTMLLLGGLFLAFGVPVSYLAINDELAKGNYAVLLVLVFPLIGALLMWQGRSKLKLWQKIGKTPFFADPFPGNAGGQIGGYFQLAQGKFVNPPQCVLRCLHKYDSGSGKNRSTKTDTLWQQQQPASADLGAKYRVLFDVPANLPGSGEHAGYEGSIVWQLSCEAELRQQNMHMEFSRDWTLPVIAGSAKAQWQRSEAETQAIQQQLKQQAAHSAASQIMTHQSGGKLQLISAAGRHLSSALTLTLFGAVFASAGGFMFYLAVHDGGVPWIMAPVFSLVGVVILVLGVFWLGRGLQANIGKREVQTIRSMFGVRLYQRNAAIADNAELALVKTLTSTKPNGHSTEYYRLQLQLEHTTLVLAEGIIGRDAAEALKQQVEQQLFS